MSKASWLHLQPNLGNGTLARKVLAEIVQTLPVRLEVKKEDIEADLERFRRRVQRESQKWPKPVISALTATVNIITDLAKQGWAFRVEGTDIYGQPPKSHDPDSERERRREQLAARRNEQLREESTQRFIREMERTRAAPKRRTSIFSLMRDGRDLAKSLASLGKHCEDDALASVIDPYIQFVDRDSRCDHSGLALNDIWRYFRHTWASPYESVPGRTMALLVRDRAAPGHPVMGVAALSSASVKLRARDEYLGWEGEPFVARLEAEPTASVAKWLLSTVERSVDEIDKRDLIADGLLSRAQLGKKGVSQDTIDALTRDAKEARERHHRQAESGEYKKQPATPNATNAFWRQQAETPLFRSKRSSELADLLTLWGTLRKHLSDSPSVEELKELLDTSSGRQAVMKIVRIARADTVGTAIADLTVCGSVPPYSGILGGKLVAMLAVSPSVVAEYHRRYSDTASIIASSVAGKRIVRPAHLVFIGTTSLYGIRPSQYDRIAIPCELLGGPIGQSIRYDFIERTVGWGTFQFGKHTKASIEQFVIASKSGWRVNNVFGEGANPRMRALREGLGKLGLDEEELLHHGQQKSMYGVKLAQNTRDYLLGLDASPKYLFDQAKSESGTAAIARFWARRWMLPRLERPETLDQMKAHTLVHPITHGARVILPDADLEQTMMF